jgi:hypothetical protein
MTAFKKFDPRAFLERERLASDSTETLAALATLAGPPLKNEIRETTREIVSQCNAGAVTAKSIELQRDDDTLIHRLDQLGKNQNLPPTPAKAAKVAKVQDLPHNFSNFSGPTAELIDTAAHEGELRALAAGVHDNTPDPGPYASALAALRAKRPTYVPEDRWHQALADATTFATEWGAEAQAFGWTASELPWPASGAGAASAQL